VPRLVGQQGGEPRRLEPGQQGVGQVLGHVADEEVDGDDVEETCTLDALRAAVLQWNVDPTPDLTLHTDLEPFLDR
jgi:hypothetical protein